MLDQIKTIYGQAFVYFTKDLADSSSYYWFHHTESSVPFGIRKHAMTDNEYRLLSLHYLPVEKPSKPMSFEQRYWSELFFEGQLSEPTVYEKGATHYLLHIAFKSPTYDEEPFEEAIEALFPEKPITLWKTRQLVVVVLKQQPDAATAKEIVDLLASDFYINVKVMTGPPLIDIATAHQMYLQQEALFVLGRESFPEKHVFSFDQLVPLCLIEKASEDSIDLLFAHLNAVLEDEGPEMRETLLTFIKHNMNLSTASKALYIHRNSLQYRLEKFMEKTGLDPKAFEDALFIYLGLLNRRVTTLVK